MTVSEDSLGSVISLDEKAALEMSYYRNNIIHAFLLPALVCRLLDHTTKLSSDALIEQVQTLISIIKPEFFLWQAPENVAEQVKQVLTLLEKEHIAKQSKAGFWSLVDDAETLSKVKLLSECAEATVQRLVIVTHLLQLFSPLKKASLEEKMVVMAKRLAILNNIHAPEFIDKKAQSNLVGHMKSLGYIEANDDGLFVVNEQLRQLSDRLKSLVDIKVIQTITDED